MTLLRSLQFLFMGLGFGWIVNALIIYAVSSKPPTVLDYVASATFTVLAAVFYLIRRRLLSKAWEKDELRRTAMRITSFTLIVMAFVVNGFLGILIYGILNPDRILSLLLIAITVGNFLLTPRLNIVVAALVNLAILPVVYMLSLSGWFVIAALLLIIVNHYIGGIFLAGQKLSAKNIQID